MIDLLFVTDKTALTYYLSQISFQFLLSFKKHAIIHITYHCHSIIFDLLHDHVEVPEVVLDALHQRLDAPLLLRQHVPNVGHSSLVQGVFLPSGS